MKILIVDDDRFMRRRLQISLVHCGHEVLEADDGRAAWELLQREPIRLVISDWMMSEWDGPELIRRIRAAELPGYTYCILLTANDSKEDIVRGLEAGADDYLTKPFDHNELLARLAIGERILNLEARLIESREQLRELAMRDMLTGLLNRRALYECAEQSIAHAAREGWPISFIMLDVDHFKAINDRYGHLIGDDALRLVARTIAGGIRPYDHLGRWGGEEFLAVLPGATLAEATSIAERMRAGIAAARLTLNDGSSLDLRISLGVAGAPSGASQSLDAAILQADTALYRAKNCGRNCVCVFAGD